MLGSEKNSTRGSYLVGATIETSKFFSVSTITDRLVLYSEGLIEALKDEGEPFGFERLRGCHFLARREGRGRA